MRKYGRWMLALGIIAAGPAVSDAQVGQRAVAGRYAQPAGQYNQQMAEQVAGALRAAKLRGYDVEIEFKDGVALLKGKVKDAANKDRATQAVKALRGVTRVDNQLEVMPAAAPVAAPAAPPAATNQQMLAMFDSAPPQAAQRTPAPAPARPSNQQVAEGIAGALSAAGLQGYDVEIRFQNGTAVLGGSVATAQQRALAERVTSQVAGVLSVNNQLQTTSSPFRTATYQDAAPTDAAPLPPGGAQAPMVAAPPQQAPPMMGGPVPMMTASATGAMYGSPNLPDYAWPAYAQYPNSAAITYPTQYSASAWPYIGPYYPYPQVPLGWRKAQLEWDDGHWQLSFNSKTDKWFWFLQPKNW